MKITFLGTGTSQGVPVIGCTCAVCRSSDNRDKRLRTSALISHEGVNILIDTGPDLRQQALRENISHIDAVLMTHEHSDHVAGIDDIRPYNFSQKKALDFYAMDRVAQDLKNRFKYIFEPNPYPGAPRVNLNVINSEPFNIKGLGITPIEIMHGTLPIYGYRIGDIAYITDCHSVPEAEIEKLAGTQILVLNSLRNTVHHSHLSLPQAIKLSHRIGADETYLTHISHTLGKYDDVIKKLPDHVHLSYDGLEVEI